jgi:hypothetical protein
MGTRSVNWLAILFVPITAIAFDVFGKVFSNMFYPTQTQIHIEIEAKEVAERNKRERQNGRDGSSNEGSATPRATTSV